MKPNTQKKNKLNQNFSYQKYIILTQVNFNLSKFQRETFQGLQKSTTYAEERKVQTKNLNSN